MMKDVSQHGYPLFYMFQIISDLLGKSQEYPGYLQGWTPWHLPLEIGRIAPGGQNKLKNWLTWSNQEPVEFHYEWNDPKKLGFILGNHLIILGLGAFLLVSKAMFFSGIYDANLGVVRLINNPTLDPSIIFGYLVGLKDGSWNLLGMASVDNLEDVIGGHIWVGSMLILGGIWHILVAPFSWVRKLFPIENGEEILSYSLLGLALMAFISIPFIAYNQIVYPSEFYGYDRLGQANIQLFLGILAFCGYVWHSWRSRQISL